MSAKEICLIQVNLFVVTFLVFARGLQGRFVDWDDFAFIVSNPHLSFRPGDIQWMFTTSFHGPYQPVPWLSLTLDKLIWGMDPFGFHLTANLLHALTACVLFRWAFALARRLAPRASLNRAAAAALACAALFALHPLRVESVTWINERRDGLVGLFTALSLLWYHRLTPRFPDSLMTVSAMRGLLVCLLLAMLSKAIAVTLPVGFVILDLYVLNRFADRSFHSRLWLSVREKLPCWFLVLAVSALAVWGQKTSSGMMPFSEYPLSARLIQACMVVALCLRDLVWPTRLSPLVELRDIPSLDDSWMLVAVILTLTLFQFFHWNRNRWPRLWAAWLCFVLTLFPTSGILQSGQQLTADRYTYLPSIPWAATLGLSLLFFPAALAEKVRQRGTRIWCGGMLLAVVLLSVMTWRQQGFWLNTEALWRRVLAVDPGNYRATMDLARNLVVLGRAEEAEPILWRETRRRPQSAGPWFLLGEIEFKAKRYDRAVIAFRKALEVELDNPHPTAAARLKEAQEALGKQQNFDAIRAPDSSAPPSPGPPRSP